MKRIGIIGAMESEVACLKKEMTNVIITKKTGLEFYEGFLTGKPVVVVRSGIGKVNAGVCTQILTDLYDIKCIINTGIAGSLSNDINIGDIVISTDTVQHDVDVTMFDYPPGQIPSMDVLAFKADSDLVQIALTSSGRVNRHIQAFKGRIVSGDQFISDQRKKERLVEVFGSLCTEMEGAAIGQVAYLNQIPYVVIRAISDKADGSATVDSETFSKTAIENSINLLKEMLYELSPTHSIRRN
jgi:adenosylhomocysteine nucleosidase